MVRVPQKVYDAIIVTRDTGEVNMMYINAVTGFLRDAQHPDYDEAAGWIDQHRKEYANAIMYGMEVEGKEIEIVEG